MYAAFEDCADTELVADRRYVEILVAVRKRRGSGRDPQALELRQHVQQRIGNTLGEIALVPVGAEVLERQDRDRVDCLRVTGDAGAVAAARLGSVAPILLPDEKPDGDDQQSDHHDIEPARRLARVDAVTIEGRFPLDAFRRDLVNPGEDDGKRKTECEQERDEPHCPFGQPEDTGGDVDYLENQPGTDSIKYGCANDVTTLEFVKKGHA
ncbi:MAG: hypothetical protein ACWGPN_05390 [Gammaproteobacteria bacterium]